MVSNKQPILVDQFNDFLIEDNQFNMNTQSICFKESNLGNINKNTFIDNRQKDINIIKGNQINLTHNEFRDYQNDSEIVVLNIDQDNKIRINNLSINNSNIHNLFRINY